MLYLLDYGAGNVRSLANSIRKLGYDFEWVKHPDDIQKASKLLFPGVGAFGPAMESLSRQGYATALREYIDSGKPYMGICIGMQALFESSLEAPGIKGIGVVPGQVGIFSDEEGTKSVPQMGWNTARPLRKEAALLGMPLEKDDQPSSSLSSSSSSTLPHFYFVHSYRAAFDPSLHSEWALTTTQYGNEVFLSSILRQNVFATQFHPEKSGAAGLEVLRAWLAGGGEEAMRVSKEQGREDWIVDPVEASKPAAKDGLTKRVVACLDVRSNDEGDLVVTKGESYDVREKAEPVSTSTQANVGGAVRNLGKPVDLALRYYLEGADEIVFLNITSFRQCPLYDQPMLAVLEAAAASIFVPLTIGGGIKDSVDPDGTQRSAKEVADAYFRAGADKVSIGSEAVYSVEELLKGEAVSDPAQVSDSKLTGRTGIEMISKAYGKQAVVISFDPRRVYVKDAEEAGEAHRPCLVEGLVGSKDEGKKWWYRCTVKGGREDRDLDVVQLARGVEKLGAGEILLNSIDQDGQAKGFDRQLIDLVRSAIGIPVVASSGAGKVEHFSDVFEKRRLEEDAKVETSVEAALAAGVFHRNEVRIEDVKKHLVKEGFNVRTARVEEPGSAADKVQRQTEQQKVQA